MKGNLNQSGITSRIKMLIEKTHMSDNKFALSVTIDQSNFKKKLSGSQPWTINDIDKISKNLNIRKGWLMDGEGEMFSAPEKMKEQVRRDVGIPEEQTHKDVILEIYAKCIRQLEDDRAEVRNELNEIRKVHQQLADELGEVRNLKAVLHEAINAFRNATKTNSYAPLMAADEG